MKITIKINEIINKKQINKISNGVNIFNHMISKYKKEEQKIEGFVLDLEGIKVFSSFVFKEIIKQMQSRLEGQFNLELLNASPIIVQQFNISIKM